MVMSLDARHAMGCSGPVETHKVCLELQILCTILIYLASESRQH